MKKDIVKTKLCTGKVCAGKYSQRELYEWGCIGKGQEVGFREERE